MRSNESMVTATIARITQNLALPATVVSTLSGTGPAAPKPSQPGRLFSMITDVFSSLTANKLRPTLLILVGPSPLVPVH